MSRDTPRRRIAYSILAFATLAGALASALYDEPDDGATVMPHATSRIVEPPNPGAIDRIRTDPLSFAIGRAHSAGRADVVASIADLERLLLDAPDEDLDRLVAQYVPNIVRLDAQAAVRFAELRTSSRQRDVLFRHVARTWGELNAGEAFAWAEALADPHERNTVVDNICLALGEKNPANAMERCARAPGNGPNDVVLQAVFQSWAERDAVSAGNWLSGQPSDSQIDGLWHRYVYVLSRTNTPEALRLVHDAFRVPADRDEALLTILHQWALREPHAAREWAINYPASDLKIRAVAELDGLQTYTATQ